MNIQKRGYIWLENQQTLMKESCLRSFLKDNYAVLINGVGQGEAFGHVGDSNKCMPSKNILADLRQFKLTGA